MIKILIMLIVAITILFVTGLCKAAKKADKKANILLKNTRLKQKDY